MGAKMENIDGEKLKVVCILIYSLSLFLFCFLLVFLKQFEFQSVNTQ